jgi:hypothetical protein
VSERRLLVGKRLDRAPDAEELLRVVDAQTSFRARATGISTPSGSVSQRAETATFAFVDPRFASRTLALRRFRN